MSEQSGKSKALRIRLDYYKHRGQLDWTRWACVGVALICSISYAAFVLAGVFWQPGDVDKFRPNWLAAAVLQVNTGPLSKVHAHLEKDCQQCHAESAFRPIASDAFKFDVRASLDSLSEKCQSCHSVRSHVAINANAACVLLDQNCAECHRDHQGRNVNLTEVASRKCTSCHTNLNNVCSDSASLAINPKIDKFSVESHATQSQTFRSLSSDPGRIKFSHAQHMNLGQVKAGRRGGFQLNMMTEHWRGHYTGVGENAVVQLTCSNCHKLQTPSGQVAYEQMSSTAASTDIEFSHFYAPIQFDEHCAACHQFTFTGQTAAMTPLPHAATREDFRQILSTRLFGGKINGHLATRKDDAVVADESSVEKFVEAELENAVDRIYTSCSKCHKDQPPERIGPANAMIPQRWLQRGLFDHGAHAKISQCAYCHVIPASEESTDSSIVMIKGPESCTPCHRSALDESHAAQLSSADRQMLLGNANQPSLASDNCTLCHRYHWSRPQSKNQPNVIDSEFTGNKP